MSGWSSEHVDVVVVGAGSAGGVVAARLSEDPARSVLLVEAGPDYGPAARDQPELVRDARDYSATGEDWGHQGWATGLGRRVDLFAGRLVGGSSATNNVMALRGHPADYDEWAEGDNPGWSFHELLPAFERVERDMDFERLHGQEGPVPVHRQPPGELAPAQEAFLEASARLGHQPVEDHNAPGAIGAGRLPLNELDGVRQSVALTYLARARVRPNLKVWAGATVSRVVIEHGRATGVELRGGERLGADRVVLSAGAYGSPAILLRSGVGPAGQLRPLGLPVHEDLRGVGRNLHDHPLLRLPFAAGGEPADPPHQTLLTARSDAHTAAPDLQVFPAGPASTDAETTLTLLVGLTKPRSRGQLRIQSPDPDAPPVIEAAYLDDAHDLERMIGGAKLARELASTAPLTNHLQERPEPGGQPTAEAVRERVGGYQHAVGSCRMGPPSDPDAVVDHTGRVHGVEDLFVIDASIMPVIPSANTNLPTMMIAEHLCPRL